VLGSLFGSKRNEMVGSWRKLYNEELHNLYSSVVIIRMVKSMGQKRNAHRILVGKPEGKRQRCRSADNIKMDLTDVGWGDMDWIDVAWNRYQWRARVKTVMNFRVA
jgi:hypothetical protein